LHAFSPRSLLSQRIFHQPFPAHLQGIPELSQSSSESPLKSPTS
jgi:hypothetical protein